MSADFRQLTVDFSTAFAAISDNISRQSFHISGELPTSFERFAPKINSTLKEVYIGDIAESN